MQSFNPLLAERAFEAVAALRATTDLEELNRIIEPVLAPLGLPYFGLGRFFQPSGQMASALLSGNLPGDWVVHYARSGYAMHSPLAREMLVTSLPYRWQSVVQRPGQNATARRILDEAGDFGLRDGLYIPMRAADMSYTAVVLSGPSPELADPFLATVAELVGAHYGLAASSRLNSAVKQWDRRLTPRQRECLLWVRAGKSSTVIGEILGISPATVNEHLGCACRTLGVATRVQAVVEAMRLGLLDS